MSAVSKLSRSAVANGGFGDPDLTPKPLRISKREHAGTTTAMTFNSSPVNIIPKSQTQHSLQALAPSQRISTRINSTQLDLSSQGYTAPTSQWGRRNTFLRVHKQRQSAPVNPTCTEPIGSLPFNPPARSRNSCPPMVQLESSSDASRDFSISKTSNIRAFSTNTPSLRPVHEIWSPPSGSSALTGRQRRAVTDFNASYKDLDNFNPLLYQGIPRQHSTKPSIVSRMMSSLTNRTHTSQTISRSRDEASQPPQDHSQFATSRARRDIHYVRQRNPSTRDNLNSERDLHSAPMAFPSPPISDTSSTTRRSHDSRRSSKLERIRELCKPVDSALMGAELTLTPGYDQGSSEKERNMLVSLDITGTTNSTSGDQDVWSQHTGLDIVVVIDNS